jgi:hypothetical protein
MDSCQKKISAIVFERICIVSVFDLCNCTGCGFIPFEFDNYCGFVQMQIPWNKADVSKFFSAWEFADDRIVFPCVIECKVDCTAE